MLSETIDYIDISAECLRSSSRHPALSAATGTDVGDSVITAVGVLLRNGENTYLRPDEFKDIPIRDVTEDIERQAELRLTTLTRRTLGV